MSSGSGLKRNSKLHAGSILANSEAHMLCRAHPKAAAHSRHCYVPCSQRAQLVSTGLQRFYTLRFLLLFTKLMLTLRLSRKGLSLFHRLCVANPSPCRWGASPTVHSDSALVFSWPMTSAGSGRGWGLYVELPTPTGPP